MFRKTLISSAVLFIFGIFCTLYSQEQEAVIKLNSPEKIEQFQKIFDKEIERSDKTINNDLGKALSGNAAKAEIAEAEFKIYKPQPKDAIETEALLQKISESRVPPKKAEYNDTDFKVYKPQAKEESIEIVKPKVKDQPTASPDDEFKVYKPEAKEEYEESKRSGEIKSLDSPEDLEEFEELLKKYNVAISNDNAENIIR